MRTLSALFTCLIAGALAGCARVDATASFADVSGRVAEATGVPPLWRTDAEADAAMERALGALLAEPLTADGAVRVAMLASPSVQAELERLGVAQADLAQAGLLKNPVLAASVRWPDSGSGTNAEIELLGDVFDLLLLPQRKKIAAGAMQRVKLDVADAVLNHAAEVRAAYWELVGAERTLAMRRAVAEAADAATELTRRMHDAGNASELELRVREADRERAALAAMQQDHAARSSRNRLNTLMGLGAMHATWAAADEMPRPGRAAEPLHGLLTAARVHRLDRRAIVAEIESLAVAADFQKRWGWLGQIHAGASADRETDGVWLIGPALEVELPIFEQGQTERARLASHLRSALRRLEVTDGQIRAEVTAASDRLELARAVADRYHRSLIPLHERIVVLSQQQVNFMLIGVFDALDARRAELDAYERSVDAVRDFWIAHAELERAIGARVAIEPVAEQKKHEGHEAHKEHEGNHQHEEHHHHE